MQTLTLTVEQMNDIRLMIVHRSFEIATDRAKIHAGGAYDRALSEEQSRLNALYEQVRR